MDTLAAAIHAFPSTSRILDGLFADALRDSSARGASSRLRPGRAAAPPGRASRQGFDLDRVHDRLDLGLDLWGGSREARHSTTTQINPHIENPDAPPAFEP